MKSVLVIDDDEDIREFLVTFLNRKGFESKGQSDFHIERLENVPDLILLDYLLAGESGLEICKKLRKASTTQATPVIMISALSDMKERCLTAGATEFLCKPFNVNDLLNCVNKVLSERA